ncbi:unnamed protein product, partial [Staurois parvus]
SRQGPSQREAFPVTAAINRQGPSQQPAFPGTAAISRQGPSQRPACQEQQQESWLWDLTFEEGSFCRVLSLDGCGGPVPTQTFHDSAARQRRRKRPAGSRAGLLNRPGCFRATSRAPP